MGKTDLDNRARLKFALLVMLVAIPVTVIFTYPLIFNWQTDIPSAGVTDGLEHAWFAWWFDKAIFSLGQSPAQLEAIFYPITYDHPLLTAMPWSRLLGVPAVHFGASILAVYNAHLFLAYILTWLFMGLLLLELTNDRLAALVGGCIFAFSANRTMHVLSGHYTQQITYFYPLLVWALWLVWKRPSTKRGLFLGLALILASVVDLMPLAYFAVPVTAVALLFFFFSDRKHFLSPPMLKSLGIGFGLAALIIIPLLFPLLWTATQGDLDWYHAPGINAYSADGASLFIPPPGHPLSQLWPTLGKFSENVYAFGYIGFSHTENIVYAGWITLLLAGIGLVKTRHKHRDVGLWLIIALAASLLALGPVLRLAGKVVTLGEGRYIILPYFLITKLPFFSWGRTPARLHFTAMFAISILATYGISYLRPKVKNTRWQWGLALGLLAILLLDSITHFPWPMENVSIPSYYQTIAADDRAVAVLDIPVDNYVAEKQYMLYQTIHQHPIVGGHAYRTPRIVEEKRQAYLSLIGQAGGTAVLADEGIGYIIIHPSLMPPESIQAIIEPIERELGSPIYQDDKITVYKLPNPKEIAPQLD